MTARLVTLQKIALDAHGEVIDHTLSVPGQPRMRCTRIGLAHAAHWADECPKGLPLQQVRDMRTGITSVELTGATDRAARRVAEVGRHHGGFTPGVHLTPLPQQPIGKHAYGSPFLGQARRVVPAAKGIAAYPYLIPGTPAIDPVMYYSDRARIWFD